MSKPPFAVLDQIFRGKAIASMWLWDVASLFPLCRLLPSAHRSLAEGLTG